MAQSFFSSLASKLARLFGGKGSPTAAPEPAPSAAPKAASVAVAAPAKAPAKTVDNKELEATALRQILVVDVLPSTPLPPASPDVRERTLIALRKLDQIPALASLAQGFARTMNRPDVTVEEVVASISKDQALSMRILRMANSTEVNSERRIEDLETAVQMLGVNRVRKAADAVTILRDANRVADGLDWRHLWIHALGTAAIAEKLEKLVRSKDASAVYLAGLLHDVGKIVLSTIAADEYRAILIAAWNEKDRLETLELGRLGVDHGEAGVAFAKQNNLGNIVTQAIAHHAKPELAESHRFEVALVSIANYLAKAYGLGFSGSRLDERDGEFEDLAAWKVLEAEIGQRPDIAGIEEQMGVFVKSLRSELAALREGL